MKKRHFFVSIVISIFLLSIGQQIFADEHHTSSAWLTLLLSSPEKVTRLIVAKEGGSISLSNGVSITIPPDALNKDTHISLGAVEVERFDENVSALGGVKGLHIIGAVFEPNGTQFNQPVSVRFPLPSDWVEDSGLVLFAANGSDPFDVVPTTVDITVTGSPGKYIAEVQSWHFTVLLLSNNCHSGTYRNIVAEFKKKGCSDEQIAAQVKKKYGIIVDPEKAEFINPESIQAFLGTYFQEYPYPYNKGEDISADTITYLTNQVLAGRQVVLAFNHAVDIWPNKEGSNGFYKSLPHTAILEVIDVIQEDGTKKREVVVRHTIVPPRSSMGATLDLLRQRIGKDLLGLTPEDDFKKVSIFFRDSFENINNFRTTKNGIPFKQYVQGKWGTTDFPDSVFLGPFPSSYQTVNIYIDKRTDPSTNPCYEEPCASRGLPGPEIASWGSHEWQRCDDGTEYNYDESISYCNDLVLGGHSDWRLPTAAELMSLVVCTNGCPTPLKFPPYHPKYCGDDGYGNDYERPTIDGSFQCQVSAYGTSSGAYPDLRWTIWFGDGGGAKEHRDSKSYVRCVRE